MLLEIYVVVFNFVQTSTKKLLWLTLVMKCHLSATSHVLFLQASQRFFHIAVNLGKHYFCKRGAGGLIHFELRAFDCAN